MRIKGHRKEIQASLIAAIFVLMMGSQSVIAGNRSSVNVSATIQKWISARVLQQESILTITQENIKKGYVDVAAGTVLEVSSNSLDGYFLIFQSSHEIAREVWVTENGRKTILATDVGMLYQPAPGVSGEVKRLNYRFILNPYSKAGDYTWPIRVEASPL